jgi:hypothetical protein
MKEVKDADAWNHTSAILCMIHNSVAKRGKKPDDFNPLKAKAKAKKGVGLRDFKDLLLKSKKPTEGIDDVSRSRKR